MTSPRTTPHPPRPEQYLSAVAALLGLALGLLAFAAQAAARQRRGSYALERLDLAMAENAELGEAVTLWRSRAEDGQRERDELRARTLELQGQLEDCAKDDVGIGETPANRDTPRSDPA